MGGVFLFPREAGVGLCGVGLPGRRQHHQSGIGLVGGTAARPAALPCCLPSPARAGYRGLCGGLRACCRRGCPAPQTTQAAQTCRHAASCRRHAAHGDGPGSGGRQFRIVRHEGACPLDGVLQRAFDHVQHAVHALFPFIAQPVEVFLRGTGHDRKQLVDHGLGVLGQVAVDLAVAAPAVLQGDGPLPGLHVPDDRGKYTVLDGTHLVADLVGPCARGPRQLFLEALVFLVAFHQALDGPHKGQVHVLAAFGGIAIDVGQIDALFRQVAVGLLAVAEGEQVLVAVGGLGTVARGIADGLQTGQMVGRAGHAAHVARGIEDAGQVLGHVARFKAAAGPGREHHAKDLFRVPVGKLAGLGPGHESIGEVRALGSGGGGGPLGQGGQAGHVGKVHAARHEGPAHGPRAVQCAAATGHDLLVQCP